MKRNTMLVAAAALSMLAGVAGAAVVGVDLTTVAPPTTLGTFPMMPFTQPPQAAIPNGTSTATVPGGPNGITLGLSPNATKQTIGSGWATWSHGYTGAVYTYLPTALSTITLPPATKAFYLYAEPNTFQVFTVTVTPNIGSPVTVNVNGSAGANGVGFYTNAGETLKTVTVTTSDASGYAIGEFGFYADLSIPTLDPAMLIALAVVLLGAGMWMYRRNHS